MVHCGLKEFIREMGLVKEDINSTFKDFGRDGLPKGMNAFNCCA